MELTGDLAFRPTPYEKRGLNAARLEAVFRHAAGRVLDVGCGNGAYVLHFKDRLDIHGVDHVESPSWKAAPDRFQVSDGARLPFSDGSFDTLLSFETVEHLEDPAVALAEYRRVARRKLVLTVPNCVITEGMRQSNLLYSHWGDPSHRSFFTLPTIRSLVEASGFRVVEARLVNPLDPGPFLLELLPIPRFLHAAFLRWARRRSKRHYITCLVVAETA